MKLRLLAWFLVPMLYLAPLKSQDAFRYTLFDYTEIAMNPSLAGSFEGTIRGGGIFREQDFGLEIGQYRNPVVYLDAPVIRGFGKTHWIGIGMYYMHDVQKYDEVNLVTNKIFGGLAYHIGFDKDYKNVLSLGIQSGSATSFFSSPDITTWSEFGDTPREDPAEAALPIKNPEGNQGSTTGRTNWVGGIHFRSDISDETQLKLGFAVANIGRVSNSLLSQGSFSRAPLRFVFHGSFKTPLVPQVFIEPRAFFQYMQPSWDMSIQSLFHFQLKPGKPTQFNAGLGYNIQNGLQFLVGIQNESLKAGLSFDLNLSDKTQVSGPAAAFELGAAYILRFYKKPKPDPVLVCPRL
jgi:type IX secretion system PorP/SprF family membrane protein